MPADAPGFQAEEDSKMAYFGAENRHFLRVITGRYHVRYLETFCRRGV